MRLLFLVLSLIFTLLASENATASKIAIVIDDIGYKHSDQKLLSIDAPLTFAVLPHTPMGYEYAYKATKSKKEVLIHLPMQADRNNHLLGEGALLKQMGKAEYQRTLLSAMEDIPFAVGINNHMGSLLTRMEQPMAWTMELLKQHNMFFLDSKTTKQSKVLQVAESYGVGSLERSVFLDNIREPKSIRWQFKRLIKLAKKQGHAVAIGHPYPETYQVLKQLLPQLKHLGIEVVPLSSLVENSHLRLELVQKNISKREQDSE